MLLYSFRLKNVEYFSSVRQEFSLCGLVVRMEYKSGGAPCDLSKLSEVKSQSSGECRLDTVRFEPSVVHAYKDAIVLARFSCQRESPNPSGRLLRIVSPLVPISCCWLAGLGRGGNLCVGCLSGGFYCPEVSSRSLARSRASQPFVKAACKKGAKLLCVWIQFRAGFLQRLVNSVCTVLEHFRLCLV